MTDFPCYVCVSLQQWPMYMVDYSGVNVQVPGKVNYWRTNLNCKGIKGVCQSDIHDSSTSETYTLSECWDRQTEYSELKVSLWMASWGTTECKWIKMLQGKSLACFLTTASTQCRQDSYQFLFPPKADHDKNIALTKLQSCYLFMKCPSTESCCWIQHLVAMYYWQKMSLIAIWFLKIQIFVLFIYYIY